MTRPIVTRVGQALTFGWAERGLTITLDRFLENKTGLHGEMSVFLDVNGARNQLLHGKVNALAIRTRSEWSRRLTELRPDIPWDAHVETALQLAVKEYRRGEPVLSLDESIDVPPPQLLIDPLIPENSPTVFFGLGGTGKTYCALLLGMLVQQGAAVCGISGVTGNVLYLDYEADHATMVYRTQLIKQGHPELQGGAPRYRRSVIPVKDDIPSLQRIIAEEGIRFVIVDSLALACGGELERPEAAIALYAALRSLNITSLLITHTPKNSEHKSPFGSVYFVNLCRSCWELKQSQEAGEDSLNVGLFHTKPNNGPLHRPIGLTLDFSQSLQFRPFDLSEEPELSKGLPLKDRIKKVLRDGGKTAKQIGEEIEVSLAQIKARLSEGQGQWCVQMGKENREKIWGLLTRW